MAIFVVDDDPSVRAVVARSLARVDRDVQAYPDARAALAGLDAAVGPIDLLLTDFSMPGELDGIGLAAVVSKRHPEIPIVLMSGDPGSLERAAGAPGVSATLAKPFTLEALCEALARAARR